MNDKELIKQEITDELTESFGVGIALIFSALASEFGEVEAERARHALSVRIQIAKTRENIPPRAVEIAEYAAMALESVCMNNAKEKENDLNKH